MKITRKMVGVEAPKARKNPAIKDYKPRANPARKPAAKPARTRANPAAAKLYTVHTVTGDGKPRDPIAHFRKRADALIYAKAFAKAYGAPVVLTGRAL